MSFSKLTIIAFTFIVIVFCIQVSEATKQRWLHAQQDPDCLKQISCKPYEHKSRHNAIPHPIARKDQSGKCGCFVVPRPAQSCSMYCSYKFGANFIGRAKCIAHICHHGRLARGGRACFDGYGWGRFQINDCAPIF
eukprot:Pgem_evm1s4526